MYHVLYVGISPVTGFVCRYEREEAFLALHLTVKNATLQDSLDQFVKGELLEGDNAYFCDKCGEKVRVHTRTPISTNQIY